MVGRRSPKPITKVQFLPPLLMMSFNCFAFRGNISARVLHRLGPATLDKYTISSNKKYIKKFISQLFDNHPSFVLGLGMYNRIDQDKLRIETECTSKDNKKLKINNFLTPGKRTKFACCIGNSYCNYISAQIMEIINKEKLETRYSFIHIPKSFQINEAVEEIEEMLRESMV